MEGKPAQTVQSVERVLRLLEIVASLPTGASAADIAKSSDLPVATVYRLLGVLHRSGYLSRFGREYRLGPKISMLAEIYEATYAPSQAVLEAVHALARESRESAFVSRWDGSDTSVVTVVEGPSAVRVSGLSTGSAGFAYARASGKVLLAFAPPSRVQRYLAGASLQPRTPNTIVDKASLAQEIDRVRATGYAIDNEEFAEGVCCISAPVFGVDDRTASLALTLTTPVYRFEQERERLVALLLRTTQGLIGCERSDQ